MTREECCDLSIEQDLMFLEGPEFDVAIIGVLERFGATDAVCYDYEKVIQVLMDQGMSVDDADEWYQFNILGSWMGDTTPVFVRGISAVQARLGSTPS